MNNKYNIGYITLTLVGYLITLFLINSCSENPKSDHQKTASLSDSLMYPKYYKELDSIQKLVEKKRIELRIIQKKIEADINKSAPFLKSTDIKEKTSYDSVLEKLSQLNIALSEIENESLNHKLKQSNFRIDSLQEELVVKIYLLDELTKANKEYKNKAYTKETAFVQANEEATDKDSILIEVQHLKKSIESLQFEKKEFQNQLDESKKQTAEQYRKSEIVVRDKHKLTLEIQEITSQRKNTAIELERIKLEKADLRNSLKASNEALVKSKQNEEENRALTEKQAIQINRLEEEQIQLKVQLKTERTLQEKYHAKINSLNSISAKMNVRSLVENERKNDSLLEELNVLLATIDSLQNGKAVRNEKAIAITDSVDTIIPVTLFEDYYPLNTSRTKIKFRNQDEVTQFIQSYIEKYLARKTALEIFELKEYFFFYIDTTGSVKKIDDERTEYNNNSKILKNKDIETFKGFKFVPVIINNSKTHARVSIGIHINVTQTKYDYKFQKDKIRVNKTPMFVEYVEPGDLHYTMIADTIKGYLNITDKFNITILDGSYSVIEYSKKEYNPFFKEKKILINENILKITKLRGIR